MGAYVNLLEYAGLSAMILASELSRRRIRSMNKVVRVGRIEYVVVLRVDKDKGFIDLSKRRVTVEEITLAESRYAMSKQVHSILARVAHICKLTLEDMYELFGWDLQKRYGHAFYAFTEIVNGDESCLDAYDLPANVRDTVISIIKRRLTPQPNLIRSTIEATCFGYEGIDAIKQALTAGQDCGTEDIPLKIRLVAPPMYTITTTAVNQELGIQVVQNAIDTITNVLKENEGAVVVRDPPRVISENDVKKLKQEMEGYERQNQEVDGDNDEE